VFIFFIFAFKMQAVFLLKNKGVFSLKEKKIPSEIKTFSVM